MARRYGREVAGLGRKRRDRFAGSADRRRLNRHSVAEILIGYRRACCSCDFAGARFPGIAKRKWRDALDLAIIGAGVSGISAAIEAKKAELRYQIFEATQVFSTVANFPKAKPIYTYPTEMRLG